MEYLLVMSISGSTMTVGCLLLRFLLKDCISAKLYFLLAKAAVLYYLIPLPFLKRWYKGVLRAVMPEEEMAIARISLRWTNYAVHAEGRLHINAYAGLQIAVVFVWVSVTGFLMARQLVGYLRTVRLITGYTSIKMTDRQKAYIDELKKEYGIRRHVLLYEAEAGEAAMTFGIYRPVIICSREIGSREAELLIRHELIHIRRLDAFWKMIMQWVTYLHWWNLIMWKLCSVLDHVCELSCDECVLKGKTKEEVNEYLRLLIEEAQKAEKPKKPFLRWRAGFGNNMKEIRERMDNLMKNKRWNRFAAGALVATLIFANSMTVFAYRDVHNEIMPEDVSQEQIESTLEMDTFQFAPRGTEENGIEEFSTSEELEILYDDQFTDEEGNAYPIPEVAPQWGCSHDYVSGIETLHGKKSDGSCVVEKYHAQMCSKCSTVIRGDWISTTTYAVCPH